MLSALVSICLLGLSLAAIPREFNWAKTGSYGNASSVCSPSVLNQHHCGGCYAFATSVTYGVTMCRASGSTAYLDVSPQFLLDSVAATHSLGAGQTPCFGGKLGAMVDILNDRVAASPTVSTCSARCSQGCLPYVEAMCGAPDGTCQPFSHLQCADDTAQPLAVPPSLSTISPVFLSNTTIDTPVGIQAVQTWIMHRGPMAVGVDTICGETTTFTAYGNNGYYCPIGSQFAMMRADWKAASGCSPYVCVSNAPRASWTPLTMDEQTVWTTCPIRMVQPVNGVCTGRADHAVAIVGWTEMDAVPVWILQNSWDTTWGDNGFFYVRMADVGNTFTMIEPTGVDLTDAYSHQDDDLLDDGPSIGDGSFAHGTLSHGTLSHGTLSHGTLSHGALSHGDLSHGDLSHGTMSMAELGAPVPVDSSSVYVGNLFNIHAHPLAGRPLGMRLVMLHAATRQRTRHIVIRFNATFANDSGKTSIQTGVIIDAGDDVTVSFDAATPADSPSGSSASRKLGLGLGISLGFATLATVVGVAVYHTRRTTRSHGSGSEEEDGEELDDAPLTVEA